MSEELKNTLEDLEDRVSDLEDRIEEKDLKSEKYKILLYPITIFNYISNLIDLQAKEEGDDQFYPARMSKIIEYFGDESINPGRISSEKIKYNPEITAKDLKKICEIISYQGWSGFNYLENIENYLDLNKPLILYYGILHLGVFFSNLHFNFTSYNRTLSSIPNMATHGINHHEINKIKFLFTTDSILSKKIKLKKMGVITRFFLAYNSSLLRYSIDETKFDLKDLLKNYFFKTDISEEFKREFGYEKPKIDFNSKMFSIYLISYYLSMLSRYKIHAWHNLLENEDTNISYFIKYFLKFAKNDYIKLIFERLIEERWRIPKLRYSSSDSIL